MILEILKRISRQFRAVVGATVFRKQPYGRMAARNRFADIKTRLSTEEPTIVDGGANNGGMTELFQKQYRHPTIYAFEPIPELVQALKQRFSAFDNIHVHGVALGAEVKTVGFNVVNNLVSSSVLKPSELNKGIHGKKMDVRQVVEVPQVRLDEVLAEVHEIDLLKLDLQGYEMEALKGCGKLLDRIKIIATEIEFALLYEGQPLFGDIDMFLRENGFHLLNLYESYTQSDGQLTAGDAVYLNNRFF